MRATYFLSLFPAFLVIIFADLGLTQTPVEDTSTAVPILANQYLSLAKFNICDASLQESVSLNVSIILIGNVTDEVTLTFGYEGPDILQPIPNITVETAYGINNWTISLIPMSVGKSVLYVNATPMNMTDVSKAYIHVSVSHLETLDYVSEVVGWVYFIAWSFSFYPQTYSNWRRHSVIGLHFDFLSLNIIGFLFYSLFNVCLYWSSYIKEQYFERHKYGFNPVQLNDVIFSLHAVFACSIQVIQCIIYERGDQVVSKTAQTILSCIAIVTFVMVSLSVAAVVKWLDFLYYVSYVKLFITLIKYIPQAYYNYRRKSTSGWSIGNILLDFTGGFLSIAQMFILAYNYNDWSSIFGDPTKFGLGLLSIVFDIFFMFQHYVFYHGRTDYQVLLSPSARTSYNSLSDSLPVDYGSTGIKY